MQIGRLTGLHYDYFCKGRFILVSSLLCFKNLDFQVCTGWLPLKKVTFVISSICIFSLSLSSAGTNSFFNGSYQILGAHLHLYFQNQLGSFLLNCSSQEDYDEISSQSLFGHEGHVSASGFLLSLTLLVSQGVFLWEIPVPQFSLLFFKCSFKAQLLQPVF